MTALSGGRTSRSLIHSAHVDEFLAHPMRTASRRAFPSRRPCCSPSLLDGDDDRVGEAVGECRWVRPRYVAVLDVVGPNSAVRIPTFMTGERIGMPSRWCRGRLSGGGHSGLARWGSTPGLLAHGSAAKTAADGAAPPGGLSGGQPGLRGNEDGRKMPTTAPGQEWKSRPGSHVGRSPGAQEAVETDFRGPLSIQELQPTCSRHDPRRFTNWREKYTP